jgi:Domain of unknown function (DUF4262)
MCWLCAHPGSTRLDYLDHLRDLIGQHGWAVQAVARDRIRPPWAYTVGLTAHGRPELVVTGLPASRAGSLLNDVAAHLLHAAAPRPGEQIPLHGGPLIEIVAVAEPAAHLEVALEFYGPAVRALQLVHADDRGRWPWEVGYRGVRGGQPVLGKRAAGPVGRSTADKPPRG